MFPERGDQTEEHRPQSPGILTYFPANYLLLFKTADSKTAIVCRCFHVRSLMPVAEAEESWRSAIYCIEKRLSIQ